MGKNPTWGARSAMRFYVEDSKLQLDHLVLMIQLRRKRILGGDKVVGEVYVTLKELYDNCGGGSTTSTNYGCHQVVTPPGKHAGFLYFTYEFGDTFRAAPKKVDDGAVAYPLVQSRPRATPSAPPCLDYLSLND